MGHDNLSRYDYQLARPLNLFVNHKNLENLHSAIYIVIMIQMKM